MSENRGNVSPSKDSKGDGRYRDPWERPRRIFLGVAIVAIVAVVWLASRSPAASPLPTPAASTETTTVTTIPVLATVVATLTPLPTSVKVAASIRPIAVATGWHGTIVTPTVELTSTPVLPEQTVTTPNYRAEFRGGQLTLVNRDGVTVLAEQSPELCLGEPQVEPQNLVSNGDFSKLDTTSLPIDWAVRRPYIQIGKRWDDSANPALIWSMTKTDELPGRGIDSKRINAVGGQSYLFSWDWNGTKLAGSSVTGEIAWWDNAEGTGDGHFGEYRQIFHTLTRNVPYTGSEADVVTLPLKAKSFLVHFRAAGDFVGTLSLANVAVRHVVCPAPAGLAATVKVTDVGPSSVEAQVDSTWGNASIHQIWRFSRTSPLIQFHADTTYGAATYVTSERFRFNFPTTKVQTIGRDLRLTALPENVGFAADALSPRLLDVPGKLLVRADGAQSVFAWQDGVTAHFDAYSDRAIDHPFSVFIKGGEGRTQDVSQTYREAGQSSSLDLELMVGPHSAPIAIGRQPNGYDATMAFSEHADGANVPASEAVNYGTSDRSSPAYGKGGFVGNGLHYTKSVFALDAVGVTDATMQEPDYLDHLKRLAAAGIEIIPHTISDATDQRPRVQAGLELFRQFNARDWIDHKHGDGRQKFEALATEGMFVQSQSKIIDLLARAGYTYAWSSIDIGDLPNNLNLLSTDTSEVPRSLIFTLLRNDGTMQIPPGFYFWSTAGPHRDPEKRLTATNIDRMVRDRGFYISHDYFPRPVEEGHLFTTANGLVTINPEFEADLEAVAAANKAGKVWVPTVVELMDYETTLFALKIREQGDGHDQIENTGSSDAKGVTLYLPDTARTVTLAGQKLPVTDGKVVLPLVPAKGRVDLTIGYAAP